MSRMRICGTCGEPIDIDVSGGHICVKPTPQPESARERFFIDHGTIHDRETGRHVFGEDRPDPKGEALELLNAMYSAFEQMRRERDELQKQWQHEHTRKVDLEHDCDRLRKALERIMELPDIELVMNAKTIVREALGPT